MQYYELVKYIKQKRQELGYSLNKFAVECEIDSAILSRIENLKQNIKINILQKIASGFEMSPAEFLTKFEQNNQN